MPDPAAPQPPARRWTDAQWRGITTTGRSLLVSAAAGSNEGGMGPGSRAAVIRAGRHPGFYLLQ